MKNNLEHKPEDIFKDIMMKFENGAPLTPDQINFLLNNEVLLSHFHLDPILKYYLTVIKNKQKLFQLSISENALSKELLQQLKNRIETLLLSKDKIAEKKVEVRMSLEQFEQFRHLYFRELIFYHGNQFLTGAPFIPGGMPHVVYFQWGNLFGIVKLTAVPSEHALISNIFVYFEEKHDRLFEKFINDYEKEHHLTLKEQMQHIPTKSPSPTSSNKETEETYQPTSPYHIPRLTLTPWYDDDKDKKK